MTNNPLTPSDHISNAMKKYREKLYPGHGGKKKCAEDFGVNAQLWRDWESGHTIPSAKNQKKIADFFGITLAELRGEDSVSDLSALHDLHSTLENLKEENAALKRENLRLENENKELTGAVKHLKDLISNPKTASDVSIPPSRITRIKTPTRK